MATAIEYQKLMTEIVYINLPGPAEPTPGMSGGELLHGFLEQPQLRPQLDLGRPVLTCRLGYALGDLVGGAETIA